MGIWIVQIIVRLFLSHIHLLADARERVAMVSTYLSLLKRGNALKEEDRQLVLQALFRPATTGVVKDDAVPITLIDAFSKWGGKGQ